VVAAAGAAGAFLELRTEVRLPVGVAGDGEDALGAIENVADPDLELVIGGKTTDLELKLAVVKIVGNVQRVRSLTVVGVAEPAARGKNGLGELVLVQSPGATSIW